MELEYAASVWDSFHVHVIQLPEMVTNNWARFVTCNYNSTASISSMKADLSLPYLASRPKFPSSEFFQRSITTPLYIRKVYLRHALNVCVDPCTTFFAVFHVTHIGGMGLALQLSNHLTLQPSQERNS